MADTAVAKVANNLREIIELAALLPEQAEQEKHRDLSDSRALADLAPVANLEAWGHKHAAAEEAAEEGRRVWPDLRHEDDTDEPALQTLTFWSEQLRRQYDAELDGRRATLESEANFLRYYADAIYRSEPRWDDFEADVRKAKARLENVLYAGKRDEATRVRCPNPDCDRRPLLRRIVTDDGQQNWWKCRSCRARFDVQGFADARRRQWSEAGDHFLSVRDAESLLRAERVPDPLVAKWLSSEGLDPDDAYLEGETRMVRWSAVYARHRERETKLAEGRKRRADRRGA